MSITGIARHLFSSRWHELERHNSEAEELQHEVLSRLIERAKDTEYGRYHRFGDMKTYECPLSVNKMAWKDDVDPKRFYRYNDTSDKKRFSYGIMCNWASGANPDGAGSITGSQNHALMEITMPSGVMVIADAGGASPEYIGGGGGGWTIGEVTGQFASNDMNRIHYVEKYANSTFADGPVTMVKFDAIYGCGSLSACPMHYLRSK